MDAKTHWENVYTHKTSDAMSWYQPHAQLSLELIRKVAPDPDARILDVGAGASTLVDDLLAEGRRCVSVLDISACALDVVRYAPSNLHAQFGGRFELVEQLHEVHHTPAGAVQHFALCHCVMH